MTRFHTARIVLAGAMLLGMAGLVSACSDSSPTTRTTVERTTTRTVPQTQPPTTVTTTHVERSP